MMYVDNTICFLCMYTCIIIKKKRKKRRSEYDGSAINPCFRQTVPGPEYIIINESVYITCMFLITKHCIESLVVKYCFQFQIRN